MKSQKRLGEILVESGKITREQLRVALASTATPGAKIGEKLLALKFLDEITLFNLLSKQLKIPIIPHEKFETIKVNVNALELIPKHFASKNLVLPIQYDPERNSISVAMIDPTDSETIKEISILCQTEKVKCYLAQRSSILWAIEKYYNKPSGDAETASEKIRPPGSDKGKGKPDKSDFSSMRERDPIAMEITEHTSVNPVDAAEMIAQELLDEATDIKNPPTVEMAMTRPSPKKTIDARGQVVLEEKTASVHTRIPAADPPAHRPQAIGKVKPKKVPIESLLGAKFSPPPPPPAPHAPAPPVPHAPAPPLAPVPADFLNSRESPPSAAALGGEKTWNAGQRVLLVMGDKRDASSLEGILVTDGYQTTVCHRLEEARSYLERSSFDVVLLKSSFSQEKESLLELAYRRNPATQLRLFSSLSSSIIGDPIAYEDLKRIFFHSIDFFMSVLERANPAQRSFAHIIAKYSRLVSQRLALSLREQDEIYLAAYLHDVWKLLKDQELEKSEDHEERRHIVELFTDIHSPYQIVPIIVSISEFFNGTGKPQGIKEDQIPIGSRIISVVRAYEEMVKTNLIKDLTEIGKISKILRKGAGKKFDPNCVEAFVHVLEGESFLKSGGVQPILEAGKDILVVDKDSQATSAIELRLINEGFTVQVVRDGQQALRLIETAPPILIISDVVLPKVDGFNLCEAVKKDPKTKHIPFIFVSSRNDDFNMTKGLEMGADDYQTKPVNVPFLITKVRKLLEQAGGPGNAPAPGDAPEGVSGNLSQMGLVEIIQILGGGARTAFLRIQGPGGDSAEVYMERGRIVSAQTQAHTGEEAFYEIMTWRDGSFSLVADRTTESKNVNNSTDFLLLEAMRRIDEAAAKQKSA